MPLPRNAASLQTGVPFELNGVVPVGTGLLLAGTRLTALPAERDGALLWLTSTMPSAELVGGTANDQLYAIAKRDNVIAAVGIARSFRGLRVADQSFVLLINGNTFTPVLHMPAADLGVQPRAIDAIDGGFAIAGRFDGGTEGFVERISTTAAPLGTVRFAFPQPVDVRVRQVRLAGDVLVVVGDLTTTAGSLVAFVAGFDVQTLAVRFANTLSHASLDVTLSDVAQVGSLVVAVGTVGADGLIAQFNAVSGAVVATFSTPGTRLSTVLGPPPAMVAGRTGSSLVAARFTSTGLAGSAFSNLTNPSNISPIPMLRVDGGAVVFGRSPDAGLARLDLNDAMEAACAGAVTGSSFSSPFQTDAGVSVTPVTLTVSPVTLQSSAIVGLVRTPVSFAESAACWP